MAENGKKDDFSLNLPTTVVTRIVKEALPEGCNVAKEAKLALARAASVFVLYLTAQANNVAVERNKKTISNRDVLEALQVTEFGRFEEPLTEALEKFRRNKESKKAKKEESMNGSKNDIEVIDIDEDRSQHDDTDDKYDENGEDFEMEDEDEDDSNT